MNPLSCNKKILVVATGGTIGSIDHSSAIDVDPARSCAAVEMARERYPGITFETREPLTVLSEEISINELNVLAKVILTTDVSGYDGVVFTCGSDNLAYLSAFIGLLSAGWEKPVTIVASDKVLTDPSANGCVNFFSAVELIRRGEAGSYVPYRNSDGVVRIHAATDLRQADLCDDFHSFNGAYAVMEEDRIILNKNYIQQTIPAVFDAEHLPSITDSVLLIHPYPLMDYAGLDRSGKRAILHTLYHSATLDSSGAIGFLETLGDVPMYLASFRSGRQRYRTAADVIAAGAIPLCDIAPECAYMKLLLACAQDQMSICEFMEG